LSKILLGFAFDKNQNLASPKIKGVNPGGDEGDVSPQIFD